MDIKVKLFSHTDLDGIGCNIVAFQIFGRENVDVVNCNYDTINKEVLTFVQSEDVKDYDRILITDISVSSEVAEIIDGYIKSERLKAKVLLFDHHKTALDLNKYDWAKVRVNDSCDIPTCGTKLLADWAFELHQDTPLTRFVEAVRNYDTWRWVELGDEGLISKQINDLYYIYGKEKFINWAMNEINDSKFPLLYADDIMVLEMRQKDIDEYVKHKNKQMVKEDGAGIVFAENYFSELGHQLCQLNEDIDFVIMVDMGGKKVSLRTEKDGLDLGELAKKVGGGGHPKAAGFQINDQQISKILDLLLT